MWRIDIVVTKLPSMMGMCLLRTSLSLLSSYNNQIRHSRDFYLHQRRDALCVLTNNCEDNEYIQVFMVLFLIRIQSTTHPQSFRNFSSTHDVGIILHNHTRKQHDKHYCHDPCKAVTVTCYMSCTQ